MEKQIRIGKSRIEKGQKMRRGKGWRLQAPKPGGKVFKATLIKRFNVGDENIAIFRVLPY